MNWLARTWRRLRCQHEWTHWRNIYGDEINMANARSVWRCSRCGKFEYRRSLHHGVSR